MSYVNTVIDRVYVINLDKDTERLHAFDKQMKKHRISYMRFPAVNGASLGYDEGLTKFLYAWNEGLCPFPQVHLGGHAKEPLRECPRI